jgi:hypothetical protein
MMLSPLAVFIDALWIFGLAGALATVSYASWYRGIQAWGWKRVFDTPGFLTALCGSVCLFAGGMALGLAAGWPTSASAAAPWWPIVQIGAWAVLTFLMGVQTVFYGLAGRRRGWNTAMQGNNTHEPK